MIVYYFPKDPTLYLFNKETIFLSPMTTSSALKPYEFFFKKNYIQHRGTNLLLLYDVEDWVSCKKKSISLRQPIRVSGYCSSVFWCSLTCPDNYPCILTKRIILT